MAGTAALATEERQGLEERLRVLVCDDEAGMRRSVVRALSRFSVEDPALDGQVRFETIEAESGEAALDIIAAQQPHILLLDHKLPGMSGLDVLEVLHEQQLDMLTVMITAYASIEAAVRATKRGAYDFLPKPFTPDELRNTLSKAARHFILEQQARRLAEERRRVRFEFISVLAHELKAPINAVDGYVNILRAGIVDKQPEQRGEILERCTTRIAGMRKMIGDLLDLTRIESGQKPRELRELNVADVARRAIETAAPEAQLRDIAIDMHSPERVPLLADEGEIEIMLNNLLSNAVKYNRDGGRVDVTIRDTGETVAVSVSDTGIGMTQEEQERLFKDFVRIKNPQTRDVLGSGLGLSILKKLALLYEGNIAVESSPDAGSSFTITLRRPEE